MIIQDYKCKCPRCSTEQLFYRALTGGKYGRPEILDNRCSKCGDQLYKKDVLNWDEVEEKIKGPEGWDGGIKG